MQDNEDVQVYNESYDEQESSNEFEKIVNREAGRMKPNAAAAVGIKRQSVKTTMSKKQ